MTNLKIISAKISRFRIKNAEWVASKLSMQLSRMIECSTHLFQSLRDQMMWNNLLIHITTPLKYNSFPISNVVVCLLNGISV